LGDTIFLHFQKQLVKSNLFSDLKKIFVKSVAGMCTILAFVLDQNYQSWKAPNIEFCSICFSNYFLSFLRKWFSWPKYFFQYEVLFWESCVTTCFHRSLFTNLWFMFYQYLTIKQLRNPFFLCICKICIKFLVTI
jgi:hypothetical protein